MLTKNIAPFEREGKEPFTIWFNKLKDKKAQAKILIRLERATYGNYGYHRKLGNDFIELKENFLGGIRIYIGESLNNLILLLGGNKSSQKSDIKKALKYWEEYKHQQLQITK